MSSNTSQDETPAHQPLDMDQNLDRSQLEPQPPYTSAELEEQLERFQNLVQQLSSDERVALDYEWAWRFKGGESGLHLGASVMIHGNEVGPLVGLLDIMESLASGRLSFPGTFTCFIGNPEAARLQRRFVDIDLNRVFEVSSLEEGEVIPHEVRRAQKLIKLLNSFDLYIDFHQTILDSAQPFYISPWSEEAWRWMRLMGGAKVWVTRDPSRGGGGLKCADEYVRRRGQPSVALELGALGFSAQARSGVWRSLSRALNAINELSQGTSDLMSLAESQPELTFYETRTRYPFDDAALTLKPGWVNFSPVRRGALLTEDSSGPDIAVEVPSEHAADHETHADEASPLARYASESGALLFPKYPPRDDQGRALDPRPAELCRIVTPLKGHPLDLWSRTPVEDHQAEESP